MIVYPINANVPEEQICDCLNRLDKTFFSENSENYESLNLSNLNQKDPRDEIFNPICKSISNYLSDEPFRQFLESPKFTRFVQWKTLEKRAVNKNTFRQYRVLGKVIGY